MQPNGEAALAVFQSWGTCPKGMCLSEVQEAWGSGHAFPDAITQWENTEQHPGDRNPPVGAPVFYQGGNHGHIAMAAGDGEITSTDCQSTGYISTTDLDWPTRAWGYPYLGWGGSLAGAQLPLAGTDHPEDDMPTTDEIRQIVADVLRSEGVSGAGDAEAMLQRGYYQKFIDANAETNRSDGVVGAGDPNYNGTQQILEAIAALPDKIAAAVRQ